MSKRNPFEADEWKAFEDRVRRDMVPKMKQSGSVVVIAPDVGTFDVQFAVQIGACILLEKPLLVIAPEGRTLPPKLERIADRVIRADGPGDPRIKDEIALFMTDFGKQ